jgi:hypothetical protein
MVFPPFCLRAGREDGLLSPVDSELKSSDFLKIPMSPRNRPTTFLSRNFMFDILLAALIGNGFAWKSMVRNLG